MTNTPTPVADGKPGDLAVRFAARLLDFGFAALLQALIGFATGVLVLVGSRTHVLPDIPDAAAMAFGGAFYFLYFVGFEAVYGYTPAKRLFGLRVHGRARDAKPTLRQSVLRNSFLLLVLLPIFFDAPDLLLGLSAWIFGIAALVVGISIQLSPSRQGIHDRMAGRTQVVKLNRASADMQPPVVTDRAGAGLAFSGRGV